MRENEIIIIAKGSGFGYSHVAANTKCYYIAKTLKSYGLNVIVLSSIFYQKQSIKEKLGKYRGIKYYSPSVHARTSSNLLLSYYKLMHIWKVASFLLYLRNRKTKVRLIFDDNSTPIPLLIILQWLGVVELIFNIEEWPMAHDIPYRQKLWSHMFATLAMSKCKKIICVSSYLIEQARICNNKAKLFKLPALAQFDEQKAEASPGEGAPYDVARFLYCGNVGYSQVIFNIIEAYENMCSMQEIGRVDLRLILHGNARQYQEVSAYVKQSKHSITLMTSLSEADLSIEFSKATALLAPLRSTVQDEARFPQKIAEYVVHAKPIITNCVGDITLYFGLEKNALIAKDFSTNELTKKMNFVVDNRLEARDIGVRGNLVGRKYFDYNQYIVTLGEFVLS